jgi:hypothetical protein
VARILDRKTQDEIGQAAKDQGEDKHPLVADRAGQPAAQERGDRARHAGDGVGQADVGGAVLGTGKFHDNGYAGDKGARGDCAAQEEDGVEPERAGGKNRHAQGEDAQEQADLQAEFVAFAVGQKTENEVRDGLADLHGDDKPAGLGIGQVPGFGAVDHQKPGRHRGKGEDDLREDVLEEVGVLAHNFRERAQVFQLRNGRFLAGHGRFAGQAETVPGEKNEHSGGRKRKHITEGKGEFLQDKSHRQGPEDAAGVAQEVGDAKNRPRRSTGMILEIISCQPTMITPAPKEYQV